MSAIILAGGRSSRMGKDKAFLDYGSSKFVYRIARELLKVSDDLMVVIGNKEKSQFESAFDELRLEGHDPLRVRILNDKYELHSPLGGMLTGFLNARHSYSAVVGCDMPLINSTVIKLLYRQASGYDCAVPIWEDLNIEPLCGVYQVKRSTEASLLTIEDRNFRPKRMVSYIPKVRYVPVASLRALDPSLGSLLNINYPQEYEELLLSRDRKGVETLVQLELRAKKET